MYVVSSSRIRSVRSGGLSIVLDRLQEDRRRRLRLPDLLAELQPARTQPIDIAIATATYA